MITAEQATIMSEFRTGLTDTRYDVYARSYIERKIIEATTYGRNYIKFSITKKKMYLYAVKVAKNDLLKNGFSVDWGAKSKPEECFIWIDAYMEIGWPKAK